MGKLGKYRDRLVINFPDNLDRIFGVSERRIEERAFSPNIVKSLSEFAGEDLRRSHNLIWDHLRIRTGRHQQVPSARAATQPPQQIADTAQERCR